MSGAGHREVDHTADLGFELWAPELEGLFSEGVLALAEICYERASVRPLQQRDLIVDGANGILGAEISCVYLFEREDWTLRLAASQGRPDDASLL